MFVLKLRTGFVYESKVFSMKVARMLQLYSKISSKKYLATIAAIPTCVDQCAFFQYVFADKSMLLWIMG